VFTARYGLDLYVYNSTFCTHSVFTCFVWISEPTAIISLYSINWLVFITETECVYCAVRAEYLNTYSSGRFYSSASHGRGQDSIPGQSIWYLYWTQWHWDRFLFLCFGFPSRYHSTNVTYSSTCCCYQDKRTKPDNVPKSYTLSEIGKHLTKEMLLLVC
jgi:hypothetical protein